MVVDILQKHDNVRGTNPVFSLCALQGVLVFDIADGDGESERRRERGGGLEMDGGGLMEGDSEKWAVEM